ncbi:unnamed protein product [Orchesella dallaii]|uniref:Uncharacterized protein n=1 Tax=Orchesella dallaii TaxID=48710 RepID=A0ABP1PNZ7_9HEXA
MVVLSRKTEPIRAIPKTADEAKNHLSPRERRQVSNRNARGFQKQKLQSTMKVLPADESLLHDFSSSQVEYNLGRSHIERFRRSDRLKKEAPEQLNSKVDNARVHDLEEVFEILTRKDGYVLEQLESLKDAVGRILELLEKQGITQLPAEQRDATIRNIVKDTLKVYSLKTKR